MGFGGDRPSLAAGTHQREREIASSTVVSWSLARLLPHQTTFPPELTPYDLDPRFAGESYATNAEEMDRSQRYRSALRPSTRLPHIFAYRSPVSIPPSQLAQAVALSRVLRPALSTLSRQSSRRSERRLARRTISAYPVCIHVSSFLFLVLIESHPICTACTFRKRRLIAPFSLIDGLHTAAQGPSATSYCTMAFGGYTADSGRPSSVIFRRGPYTSPCMTGSKPGSANCLWALTHRS